LRNEIRTATGNEELSESEVIIGLSFGILPNGSPGLPNGYLANVVTSLYKVYQLPLILQGEVADALQILDPTIPIYRVISEHQDNEKKYLDTYEVLRQSKEICKNNDWETIILVAHQDHLPRAFKVAEKLGFIVSVPTIGGNCPYDKESAQRWTRSKFQFAIREKFATIIYSHEGKI